MLCSFWVTTALSLAIAEIGDLSQNLIWWAGHSSFGGRSIDLALFLKIVLNVLEILSFL